jgi:hypothetical protein
MTDKTSRFKCKGQDIKHFVSPPYSRAYALRDVL